MGRSPRRRLRRLIGDVTNGLLLICLGGVAWAGSDASELTRSLVLSVQCRGETLSVTSEQVPLRAVLAELIRQVPLRVSVTGPVAEELVSVQFSNLPLREGIERILEGKLYGAHPCPYPISAWVA